jgi:hypothetical protein
LTCRRQTLASPFPQLDILGILIAYLVRGVSSSPRAGVYLYFKDHPA